MPETFVKRTNLPAAVEEAFAWHERPGAFERLTPPWERVRLVERSGGIRDGARVVVVVHAGPIPRTWVAEHRDYVENRRFRDVQLRGPFTSWVHTHDFEPSSGDSCQLEDHIEYVLPFGWLGRTLGGAFTRRKLERMFRYRHETTRNDLERHAAFRERSPMKILISGASGFIASALIPFLTTGGHEVVKLVRSKPGAGEIAWDPARGRLDAAAIEGFDAVIHLAGESIAEGKWTPEKKIRIRESRIKGTTLLSDTLAKLSRKPKVFVSASAVGYYGHREEEILPESIMPGMDYLSRVCREWENAADSAAEAGIRVVHPRIGIVLSPKGGALGKMLTPFNLGVGGKLGDGTQYMSWVAMDDAIGAIIYALENETVKGPVNVVSPNPVTNAQFTETLGKVLGRPTVLSVPAFALRFMFGEFADAALLISQRVEPKVLKDSGYKFLYPDLEGALRHVLGKG
jgi:uncharacterized protein (TIGR01777 family)